MKTNVKTKINVGTYVHAPVERVWQIWTDPYHIKRWNNASTGWFTPYAENDLREGGRFLSRMEARDGSFGFDFSGTYTIVEPHSLIEYTLDDGRRVRVKFEADGNRTRINEIFEAESSNPEDLQRDGWQAILDNFKYHAEKNHRLEPMQFEIGIDASRDRVYQVMIDKDSYREWTAEFSSSSHFEGSWDKGSEIRFIGEDQDGNMGGMVSRIRENIPGRYISIEHLGILKDGQVIREGTEVELWSGGLEDYTFIERDGKTLLSIDVDVNNDYRSFFEKTWPGALDKLKSICEHQAREKKGWTMKEQIYPCFWFNGNAGEAAAFYTKIFPDSRILEDTPMVVTIEMSGRKFMLLNGGPEFTFNPSISFFVLCENGDEVEKYYKAIMKDGSELMPLDTYDFSPKYAWVADRFGVNWQLYQGKMEDVGQKFVPSLMFTGDQHGRAEEAVHFYTSLFPGSDITGILKYTDKDQDEEGTVKHGQFKLGTNDFMCMDSSFQHGFGFNEAISLVVECESQEEIDFYWNRLTEGGEESRCGWLKDRFGVSWQIVPVVLRKLLADPSRSERVTEAFLKMRKFNIEALVNA